MKTESLAAVVAAALAALAVVYVVNRKRRAGATPTSYAGNLYADRETALMFKDQERLFQAY